MTKSKSTNIPKKDEDNSREELLLLNAFNVITGTEGNNTIYGTENSDEISGLGGHDSLFGLGGDDDLYGGGGNDYLWGGFGNDKLYGEGNHDRLYGDHGNDELYGGGDYDILFGYEGEDILDGGAGDDLMYTGGLYWNNDEWKDHGGTLDGHQWGYADFNGDGKDDLLTVNNENNFSVGLSNGTNFNDAGNFEAAALDGFIEDTQWLIGDFNNDGWDDLIVGDINKGYYVSTFNGSEFVVDEWLNIPSLYEDPNWAIRDLKIADFNGDGMDDIIIGNFINDYHFFVSDGNSFHWVDAAYEDGFTEDHQWQIGDFNGDGSDDIIVGDINNDYYVSTFNGSEVATNKWVDILGPDEDPNWTIRDLRVFDFNGDGMDDIIIGNSPNDYHVYLSDGESFTWVDWVNHDGSITDHEWKIADFNGDGMDDIVVVDQNNDFYVSISQGNSFLAPELWKDHGDVLGSHEWDVFDFNGDGMDDLVVVNVNNEYYVSTSNGTGFDLHRLIVDHDGSFSDVEWSYADFDGDGVNDLIVADQDNDYHVSITQESFSDDYAYGGDGHDYIEGDDSYDEIYGGAGNDEIHGKGGDDTVYGGVGDDYIDGGEGNDMSAYTFASSAVNANLNTGVVTGGDGTDTLVSIENLHGSAYGDTLVGDEQDNIVHAHIGNDYVEGNGGSDTLYGNVGNDTINAGSGDDFIYGGEDNDYIDGGEGNDMSYYTFASSAVNASLITGVVTGGDGTDTLVNIENLHGSVFNDILVGDEQDNVIKGHVGDDIIEGNGGNDTIYGNVGNDIINAGAGDDIIWGGEDDDIIDGGEGVDVLSYKKSGSSVVVDMISKTMISETDGFDEFINVENIEGSNYNDILIGDDQNNEIEGGLGDDEIYGGGGEDKVVYQGNREDYTINVLSQGVYEVIDNVGDEGVDTLYDIETLVFADGEYDPYTAPEVTNEISDQEALINEEINFSINLDNHFEDLDGDELSFSVSLVDESGNLVELPEWINYSISDNVITFTGLIDDEVINTIRQSSTTFNIEASDGISSVSANFNINNNALISGIDEPTENSDYIVGLEGVDEVYALDGDDIIFGNEGRDKLRGQGGNDTIYGGDQGDIISGGGGEDHLYGEDGKDKIYGSHGNDYIDGGNSNDKLRGDNGDDVIIGGNGDDQIYGGSGYDQARYLGVRSNYIINDLGSRVYEVIDLVGNEGIDKVIEVESLMFADGEYKLNTAPDILQELPDQEVVINEGFVFSFNLNNYFGDIDGDDLSFNISLDGNSQSPNWINYEIDDNNVVTFTGLINDAVINDIKSNSVTINISASDGLEEVVGSFDINNNALLAGIDEATNNNDYIIGSSGNDLVYGLNGNDIIYGNEGVDDLKGQGGADTIYGGDQGDKINGGGGNDILYGEAGKDKIYGSYGDDYIDGGGSNDKLVGNQGADILIGGAGNDQFVYNDLLDSQNGESDFILDFVQNEDILNLEALDFNSLSKGEDSAVTENTLEYFTDNEGNTIIQNADESFQIKLQGSIELQGEDFIF